MKILVAIDGSPNAIAAVRYVVRHANALAQPPEIHLFHAHPPIPYPGAVATIGEDVVQGYMRGESEAVLRPAEAELGGVGIPCRSSWRVGPVVPEIASYVQANGIDVVVMGTRGHGALASAMLGSNVAKSVATLSVPVIVVPERATRQQESRRVLEEAAT